MRHRNTKNKMTNNSDLNQKNVIKIEKGKKEIEKN